MDILTFAKSGLESEITDVKIIYRNAVNKLGGQKSFQKIIPFGFETLRRSYNQDNHFNTDLTPLARWDKAAGTVKHDSQPPKYSINYTSPIWRLLTEHDITCASQSQLIMLLKTAAEMWLEEQTKEEMLNSTMRVDGIRILNDAVSSEYATQIWDEIAPDIVADVFEHRKAAMDGPEGKNLIGMNGWSKFDIQQAIGRKILKLLKED